MLPLWLAAAIETESDRSKMEQLYDEYERRLYSVAFRYLHDKYRAEDAVHDVFINLIPMRYMVVKQQMTIRGVR